MATRFFDKDSRTYAYLESGKLVLTEVAPAHFEQSGRLDLSGNLDLCELPEGLRVEQAFFRGCTRLTGLPARLDVRLLSLADCTGITVLPGGLTCDSLNLRGTRVRSLPDDLSVVYRLDLSDCRELTHLPAGLRGTDRPRSRHADDRITDCATALRLNSYRTGSTSVTWTSGVVPGLSAGGRVRLLTSSGCLLAVAPSLPRCRTTWPCRGSTSPTVSICGFVTRGPARQLRDRGRQHGVDRPAAISAECSAVMASGSDRLPDRV